MGVWELPVKWSFRWDLLRSFFRLIFWPLPKCCFTLLRWSCNSSFWCYEIFLHLSRLRRDEFHPALCTARPPSSRRRILSRSTLSKLQAQHNAEPRPFPTCHAPPLYRTFENARNRSTWFPNCRHFWKVNSFLASSSCEKYCFSVSEECLKSCY